MNIWNCFADSIPVRIRVIICSWIVCTVRLLGTASDLGARVAGSNRASDTFFLLRLL